MLPSLSWRCDGAGNVSVPIIDMSKLLTRSRYDELKRRIVNWGVPADVRAHLGASLIAGE